MPGTGCSNGCPVQGCGDQPAYRYMAMPTLVMQTPDTTQEAPLDQPAHSLHACFLNHPGVRLQDLFTARPTGSPLDVGRRSRDKIRVCHTSSQCCCPAGHLCCRTAPCMHMLGGGITAYREQAVCNPHRHTRDGSSAMGGCSSLFPRRYTVALKLGTDQVVMQNIYTALMIYYFISILLFVSNLGLHMIYSLCHMSKSGF